jgi:N-acetylglucosaminyldiphosphoundecaprenol N-acetyl-beta-D-mannosaminyltransferase
MSHDDLSNRVGVAGSKASSATSLPVTRVLGVRCHAADPAKACDSVLAAAGEHAGGYVCFCNVHVLTEAQYGGGQFAALESARFVFADGAPVAYLQRRGGLLGAQRVAGPDLMASVMSRGRGMNLRHFLLGGTPELTECLAATATNAFPGIEIAGRHSPAFGPISDVVDETAVELIRGSGADVVWVGLGTPKQDQWMHTHADRLGGCLMLGVGAGFDFMAGTKRRAPTWMQDHGLEWAFRLLSEPRRLGPRYLVTNARFAISVARERAAGSPAVRLIEE